MSDTNGHANGTNGHASPPPDAALPWRLFRMDLRRAGASPQELAAAGAPVTLTLDLISSAATGKALVALVQGVVDDSAAAIASAERDPKILAAEGKLSRLIEARDRNRAELAAVEESHRAAMLAARKALADETDPAPFEQEARAAKDQAETLNNRIDAMAPLITMAATAVRDRKEQAVIAKRTELRQAAVAELERATAEATAAISSHITALVRARAAVQATPTGMAEVGVEMRAKRLEEIRKQIERVEKAQLGRAPAPEPPREHSAMLDEEIPASLRNVPGMEFF